MVGAKFILNAFTGFAAFCRQNWGYVACVLIAQIVLYIYCLYLDFTGLTWFVLDFVFLALIAIPLHRFLAHGDAKRKAQNATQGTGWYYVLDWVVIGLVVGMPLVAFLYLTQSWFPDTEFVSYLADGDELDLLPLLNPLNLGWPHVYFLMAVGFTYMVLRFSMTLPHVAIEGDRLSMPESWQLTRRFSGALLVTAVITLLLFYLSTVVTDTLDTRIWDAVEAERLSRATWSILMGFVLALIYMLHIAIGAGTLTYIYLAVIDQKEVKDSSA